MPTTLTCYFAFPQKMTKWAKSTKKKTFIIGSFIGLPCGLECKQVPPNNHHFMKKKVEECKFQRWKSPTFQKNQPQLRIIWNCISTSEVQTLGQLEASNVHTNQKSKELINKNLFSRSFSRYETKRFLWSSNYLQNSFLFVNESQPINIPIKPIRLHYLQKYYICDGKYNIV